MRALLKVMVTSLTLTAGGVAYAQTPPSAAPAPATTAAPAPATAPSAPGQTALQRGLAAMVQHNTEAAMAAFREAVTADPRSGVAPLYLGLLARSRDDAATAMAQFREALRIATAEGDDATHARALAAQAELEERAGHWDQARSLWQQFVVFADGHSTVADGTVGRARIETIGRRGTLNTEYEPVRQRIAERLARNASGADQQPPPPQLPPSAIRPR